MSLCFRYFKPDDIDNAVPLGVPVDIMSPGSSVMTLLKLYMIFSTFKTRFFVDESCLVSPFTLVVIRRLQGSETSSVVVSHGPHGPNVSKPFALLYCLSTNCTSRAETSFNTKYPAT